MNRAYRLLNVFGRRFRSPMSCPEVGRLLQRYLDGGLDAERTRHIVEHLDDCRRCGLEVETYERIRVALVERRGQVPAESIARLHEFGQRLSNGPDNRGTHDR